MPPCAGTSNGCDSRRSPRTTATAWTVDPAGTPENRARPSAPVCAVARLAGSDQIDRHALQIVRELAPNHPRPTPCRSANLVSASTDRSSDSGPASAPARKAGVPRRAKTATNSRRRVMASSDTSNACPQRLQNRASASPTVPHSLQVGSGFGIAYRRPCRTGRRSRSECCSARRPAPATRQIQLRTCASRAAGLAHRHSVDGSRDEARLEIAFDLRRYAVAPSNCRIRRIALARSRSRISV